MVTKTRLSCFLVRNLCRDFARTMKPQCRFGGIGSPFRPDVLRKGMFPVEVWHVSHLERSSIVLRKTIYRTSKRHVSQRGRWKTERREDAGCVKVLIDRRLQISLRIAYLRARVLVVGNKC